MGFYRWKLNLPNQGREKRLIPCGDVVLEMIPGEVHEFGGRFESFLLMNFKDSIEEVKPEIEEVAENILPEKKSKAKNLPVKTVELREVVPEVTETL